MNNQNNNELQTFFYNNKKIRTAVKDGYLLWILKDVCDTLGLAEPHRVAARLDEDDRTQMTVIDALGRNQETIVVNESGLYNVILRSDKPEAKRFKRWITHEVLPSIRKFGAYITPEKLSELENNPDALPRLIKRIQQDKIRIETLQDQVKEQTAKVALANAFLSTGETVTVGEFAKVLNSNGVDIGQNRLFKILRDNGFIMKLESSQFNTPTQKASDMKLLRVVRRATVGESGGVSFSKTTQITTKGQLYFINFFLTKSENEESKDRLSTYKDYLTSKPKNLKNREGGKDHRPTNLINFNNLQKKKG
jgi:anti-repressor protein